jgi:hypothetical protein
VVATYPYSGNQPTERIHEHRLQSQRRQHQGRMAIQEGPSNTQIRAPHQHAQILLNTARLSP